METIEALSSAIKLFQKHIDTRLWSAHQYNLPLTNHKIKIYAMCIERLSQRLIKELNKVNV